MLFPSWTYPAGGLFFSIEDLCKWAVALDNNSILKPEFKTECGLLRNLEMQHSSIRCWLDSC